MLPRRFNVVGSSASGKSTFSRRLAETLGIPHLEMDALFWKPHWRMSTDEEFFGILERELAAETWVLDGNYDRSGAIKWRRVQTVVWLDYSFARTFFQSVTRAIRRAWTKVELWPGTGNRESFRKSFFHRDSIILWSVMNHAKIRRRYLEMLTDERLAHIQFVRLASPREANRYLATLTTRP